jgi:hypothetical protein
MRHPFVRIVGVGALVGKDRARKDNTGLATDPANIGVPACQVFPELSVVGAEGMLERVGESF